MVVSAVKVFQKLNFPQIEGYLLKADRIDSKPFLEREGRERNERRETRERREGRERNEKREMREGRERMERRNEEKE